MSTLTFSSKKPLLNHNPESIPTWLKQKMAKPVLASIDWAEFDAGCCEFTQEVNFNLDRSSCKMKSNTGAISLKKPVATIEQAVGSLPLKTLKSEITSEQIRQAHALHYQQKINA